MRSSVIYLVIFCCSCYLALVYITAASRNKESFPAISQAPPQFPPFFPPPNLAVSTSTYHPTKLRIVVVFSRSDTVESREYLQLAKHPTIHSATTRKMISLRKQFEEKNTLENNCRTKPVRTCHHLQDASRYITRLTVSDLGKWFETSRPLEAWSCSSPVVSRPVIATTLSRVTSPHLLTPGRIPLY